MLREKEKQKQYVSARANEANKHIDWLIFFINNSNDNRLKISIALFPDVIKSALQKFHIKLNAILNGEKVKNKI